MNLKQLEAFLWVARLGSFSKTAERLFTTQPAISSRIANLEDELRTVLFDREGGAVRITAAGHGLLPLAEDALGAVQTMRERAGMPAEVSGLHALQTLGLSGNRLTSLPDELASCVSLRLLALSANLLTSIPHTLASLPELHELRIDEFGSNLSHASFADFEDLSWLNPYGSNDGMVDGLESDPDGLLSTVEVEW